MRIVVAGSSGFVGRRLCPALEDEGHDVVAMTRHPEAYDGAGTAVRADVHDAGSLDAALAGADAAYYLVHSLDDADFRHRDAEAATSFAHAAARAGLRRCWTIRMSCRSTTPASRTTGCTSPCASSTALRSST